MVKEINLNLLWEKIIKETVIENATSQKTFDYAIKKSLLYKIDDKSYSLIIFANNDFSKVILESEFYEEISSATTLITNSSFNLLFYTKEEWRKKNRKKDIAKHVEKSIEKNESASLNPRYLLSNFVVSEKNEMLYQASLAICANLGLEKWNPFFIYGNSGLGKTHILHAIGNKIKSEFSYKKIKYIESKDFGKIVHEAMQNENTSLELEKVKNEYLQYDVLLIDDIQMIQSWAKAKDIFFTIFSNFINNQKQVIITSDLYSTKLGDFEKRFITRFQGGLSIKILPPDVETAVAILKLKIKLIHNLDDNFLTKEALEYIALNFKENVRKLEGAINRLMFWNIQTNNGNKKNTLNDVREIFNDILEEEENKLNSAKILSFVSKYYMVSISKLKGKSRESDVVLARNISIYLIRIIKKHSFKKIGKTFGKSHTTIMASINNINKKIESDKSFRRLIRKFESELTGKKTK